MSLRCNKARWSFHVDFLLKITMQECIFDIQLMKWPTKVSSTRNKSSYCTHFCNGCKCLVIVNSIGLSVTPCHQPRLVSFYFPFWGLLHDIHPFASDWSFSCWQRNKIPCLVLLKSFHFLQHGLIPLWVLFCCFPINWEYHRL